MRIDNRVPHWRRLSRHPMTWVALFWFGLGLLYVPQQLIMAAVRVASDPDPVIVLSNFGIWIIWAAFTPVVWRITQRWPIREGRLARHFGIHALAALLLAAVHLVLMVGWLKLIGRSEPADKLVVLQLSGVTATNIMLYALTAIACHGYAWWLRYREAERLRVEAQLTALRAQLDPHFLFNTLNALAELAHQDASLTERLVLRLSELLRRSLSGSAQHLSTLAEELDFLEAYLDIHRALMRGRLQVEVEVAPELRSAQVPNLLLQPLVENAIRHGLAPKREGGRIDVQARRVGEQLEIVVRDDGVGGAMPTREGIGLGNLRRRLDVLYGGGAKMHASGRDGGGFEVRLCLPPQPVEIA
jgi:anti-sigma regulatory factor (Ser/Thr protein kinase)